MGHALYLLLHGAGGLTHDVAIWKDYARYQSRPKSRIAESEETAENYAGLSDAAELLRRLSRRAKLGAQEAKLLCTALTIVEQEADTRSQAA
ncbi:hypothetical protein [Nisaea sp.]|uniref:hypothetical protein n=1 Tax=Nisaea sp. TaxID=2024842 RepID=UPI0032EAECC7